tara:strand:- start:516 stop:818 length:303 start_codon:yes stop_codon:yes gene_type:complete
MEKGMQELADLYMTLGAGGFVFVMFGFVLYNIIQQVKLLSEDLDMIRQDISKMQTEVSNAHNIIIKLVDRTNVSDSKREDFWREISDDLSFLKGRINGRP